MKMMEWLDTEPGKAAVAGALGGIVRWVTLRHNWREGSFTLIVGSICAMYLGPVALPIVEGTIGKIVPQGDMSGLSSFLVGIGGISLSAFIIDIFDRTRFFKKPGEKNDDSSN
jgi:hypothetical protein